MDKQDNGRKTRRRFGTGWMVALASVAVLGLTFAAQAYPPGGDDGRAERERTGFDTNEIRNRLGIPDFGQPLPAERLDGVVDRANELRDSRQQPARSAVGARDSTGAGISGGDPRAWERNQCIAAGGNWDAARNYCSFAERVCRDMGWRWVGNECLPPELPPQGGSLVSTGVFEGCNQTASCTLPGFRIQLTATDFTTGATCTPTRMAPYGTRWAQTFHGNCPSPGAHHDFRTNVGFGQWDVTRLVNLCPWGGRPVQTSPVNPATFHNEGYEYVIQWHHTWQCFR